MPEEKVVIKVVAQVRDAQGRFTKFTKETQAQFKKVGIEATKTGQITKIAMNRSAKATQQAAIATGGYNKKSREMRLVTGGAQKALGILRNQLLVIAFAYHTLTRVITPMVKLSLAQEVAERKLEAALLNSAMATAEQVEKLKALADQLQKTTMFGNEQIINAQAMLGTFKLNAEQIETLIPLVLDMATAIQRLGGEEADLQQIAIALGKGVTGNIGVLSRYGVVISDQVKKHGDFNDIVKEVAKNYAGMAEAVAGTTFQGQLTMTKNIYGDYQKQLGNILTQSIALLAVMELLRGSIEKKTERLKAAREEAENFVGVWEKIIIFFYTVGTVFRTIGLGIANSVRIVIRAYSELLQAAIKIGNFIKKLGPDFARFLPGPLKALSESLTRFTDTMLATLEEMDKRLEAEIEQTSKNIREAILDDVLDFADALRLKQIELEKIHVLIKNQLGDMIEDSKGKLDAWAKYIEGQAKSAATAMSKNFSDFFFDILSGQLKKAEEYFRAFGQAVLRIITDIMAKQLVAKMGFEKFFAMAFGFVFPTGHQGGMVQGGRIQRYQQGGVVPALLEPGEGVVSRRGMAGLGVDNLARLNRGEGVGGDTYIYNIAAIDAASFRERLMQNADIFEAQAGDAIINNRALRGITLVYG